MKTSFVASTFALLAIASAAPTSVPVPERFTFSLINDLTGASAASSVAIGAPAATLKSLFPWATNLIKDGKLIATSAQSLNPGLQNVFCTVRGPNGIAGTFEVSKLTFVDVDGTDKAVETDVSDITIACSKRA